MNGLKKFFKNFPFARFNLIILGILTLYILWRSAQSPLARALQKQEPIFVLFTGMDWMNHGPDVDALLLARYDPRERFMDLLAIPADTKMGISNLRIDKLSEVYTYAYRASGGDSHTAQQELMRAIQWVLSLSTGNYPALSLATRVPHLHYYVQVDYAGFSKIINLLGGIPITFEKSMYYDDPRLHLQTHFEPGSYWLNGKQALNYLRFHQALGDLKPLELQQDFFLRVVSQFKNPFHLFKLPQILYICFSTIQTNLNRLETILVLLEFKRIQRDHIRLMQFPGERKKDLWIPNPEGVRATLNLLLRPPSQAQREQSSKKHVSKVGVPGLSPIRSKTTVEVWNAAGQSGMALEVVRKLRNAGFDVVQWGNYTSRQKRTLVRDYRGNSQQAQALVGALGSLEIEIFTQLEEDPLVDIEVILGEDYRLTE
jgi:LCP family protein required for cell wall assembly